MQIYGDLNDNSAKMVSKGKRNKYDLSSSEDDSFEDHVDDTDYFRNSMKMGTTIPKTSNRGRKPKCFSKNALMARENRLKKKMYISRLEQDVETLRKENKNLTSVVENQSVLISELRKEVKYLKSVITNSSDISCLIKNINQSTGMAVRSSLDEKLSQNVDNISNPIEPIPKKSHPWEEKAPNYSCFPTPESNFSPDSQTSNDVNNDLLDYLPLDFPINMSDEELLKDLNFDDKNVPMLEEHNYTNNNSCVGNKDDDDVGVCLHVSKHRVSLEFCPTCSENASQAWSS